jgi:long-chain acyl-CoA synthetase
MNLDTEITYGFTSGTTGIPKGVIFTHRMVIGQCLAMIGHYELKPNDVHMSYLPIAHSFERFVTWTCVFFGVNIRYARHPISEILKDFAISKPTTIPIVPRLLNKFYPILKGLYEKEGNYNKIRAMFGGRLRVLATGSAPVAPTILLFFSEALGADIREGYGQT